MNRKTDQKVVIKDKEACLSCKKCERVCPVQLAPYKEFDNKGFFNNESCIRCSTCIDNCPLKLLEKDIA
jgi:ferredoxin